MEQQRKNEIGNIYGSRVSKNGKWLNLLIVTHINGQEIKINCPIRLEENAITNKPYARLEMACTSDGVRYAHKAVIADLPVYDEKKQDVAKAAEDSDLPF